MSGESSGTYQTDEEYAWAQTAHLFCERLGIERKADAHHICVGISRLQQHLSDCKSSLRAVEAGCDGLPCEKLTNMAKAHTKAVKRAEAAEAREKQLRAETIEECAKVAYNFPHYVNGDFSQRDEEGLMLPGSPYDRGRYDARKAIRSLANKEGGK